MTSKRPCRQPYNWQECREKIVAYKAGQFDAVLMDAAETLWPIWEKKSTRNSVIGISAGSKPSTPALTPIIMGVPTAPKLTGVELQNRTLQ